MAQYKDILITIDWFDFDDSMSRYHKLITGRGDCHLGLRHADDYLLPTYPKKIKTRYPLVVYAAHQPHRSIHIMGQQWDHNPNWIRKHVGKYLAGPLALFLVTHANFVKDCGMLINTPRTMNCVDIIADTIAQVGILTQSRTPLAFYKELETHPMRVG